MFNRGEMVGALPDGVRDFSGQQARQATAERTMFADRRASAALGGGGFYRPTAVGLLTHRMPADEWPCKFDICGHLRKNDGTGAIGPVGGAGEV